MFVQLSRRLKPNLSGNFHQSLVVSESLILRTFDLQLGLQRYSSTSSPSRFVHKLSETIALLTPQQINKGGVLKKYKSNGRPLTVLLCWLMAKNSAVYKYSDFYMSHGFDVLTVRITPSQLLWPKSVVPIIRNELLPILDKLDHQQRLLHGFSVGGHVYAQMLRYGYEGHEKTLKLFKGQVFDSVCDIEGTAIGVSNSVFPRNKFLQKSLEKYIEFHMKVFWNVATKYYEESHNYFYNHPLLIPGLFFCSQIDPMSSIEMIKKIEASWVPKGIEYRRKVWPNTQHVGHMRKHPEEYQHHLIQFISNLGLLDREDEEQPQEKISIRAKG